MRKLIPFTSIVSMLSPLLLALAAFTSMLSLTPSYAQESAPHVDVLKRQITTDDIMSYLGLVSWSLTLYPSTPVSYLNIDLNIYSRPNNQSDFSLEKRNLSAYGFASSQQDIPLLFIYDESKKRFAMLSDQFTALSDLDLESLNFSGSDSRCFIFFEEPWNINTGETRLGASFTKENFSCGAKDEDMLGYISLSITLQ